MSLSKANHRASVSGSVTWAEPTDFASRGSSELERARRIGERLRAEVASIVRHVPLQHRSVTSMSRWLEVSRPICHRTVACSLVAGDGLNALSEAPGVRGLTAFVLAAEAKGLPEDTIHGAKVAIEEYASLLDRMGSRTKLLRFIEQSPQPTPAPLDHSHDDPRRLAFEGLRAVTGREYDCQAAVYLYAPSASGPDQIDCLTALGLIGVHCESDAMPICPVSRFGLDLPEGKDSWTLPAMRAPGGEAGPSVGLVERFSSKPAPRIVVRREGSRVPVLVDPPDTSGGRFDVVLASQHLGQPHPGREQPPTQFCWLMADGPARHLVLQVFMHRSLAMHCVASAGVFAKELVGVGTFAADGTRSVSLPRDRWFDRLREVPTIEYLGIGLERAGCAEFDRLGDLSSHLFELGAWNASEFIGYRVRVEYPIWNTQHLIWFDFDDEHADPAAVR